MRTRPLYQQNRCLLRAWPAARPDYAGPFVTAWVDVDKCCRRALEQWVTGCYHRIQVVKAGTVLAEYGGKR